MQVAAIQMVSTDSLVDNLAAANALVGEAAAGGAKLAVLPESFSVFGGSNTLGVAKQEEELATTRKYLSALAQKYQIYLVGGTIPRCQPINKNLPLLNDKVFAAVHAYNPAGEEIARYDKIHLFDAGVDDAVGRYCESDTFARGEEVVVVETSIGRLGFAVCFDLRFPMMSCQLQSKGLDILVVPSAFTKKTGEAHWLPLLRARAIENQCLVVAANQGGDHGAGRETFGHSCVIDAWGEVLSMKDYGEGVVLAHWSGNQQQSIRQSMPLLTPL